ncbi:MAG: hypothetical protein AB1478_11500 [Nitrospirota bacterium]
MEIILTILGISGVFASVLGLVLAFYAVFVNGKANREMLREIREGGESRDKILEEVQRSGERQAKILEEVQKGTIEIQRSGERQGQMLERQSQILKEVQASAERIEETQKYVAELVRIEGEKTRSLITH